MKKALNFITTAILAFVLFDILILWTALAQIAYEGRTGYWNPFWEWQAKQVVRLMDYVSY